MRGFNKNLHTYCQAHLLVCSIRPIRHLKINWIPKPWSLTNSTLYCGNEHLDFCGCELITQIDLKSCLSWGSLLVLKYVWSVRSNPGKCGQVNWLGSDVERVMLPRPEVTCASQYRAPHCIACGSVSNEEQSEKSQNNPAVHLHRWRAVL